MLFNYIIISISLFLTICSNKKSVIYNFYMTSKLIKKNYQPPIGAAKLHATPTAQAAASISLVLDSF